MSENNFSLNYSKRIVIKDYLIIKVELCTAEDKCYVHVLSWKLKFSVYFECFQVVLCFHWEFYFFCIFSFILKIVSMNL